MNKQFKIKNKNHQFLLYNPKNKELNTSILDHPTILVKAYHENRLHKGYSEVINAIHQNKALHIYISGHLDLTYGEGLNRALGLAQNPNTKLRYLNPETQRWVYDTLSRVTRGSEILRQKPKRFFKTRIFAIEGLCPEQDLNL